jgi:hypothetical protein
VSTPSEAIRGAIEAALPPRYRPLMSWSEPRRRDWSWHIDAAGGGRRLLVKVPRWEGVDTLEAALGAGPQRDTEEEFSALGAIARAVAASGDTGLTAVHPVIYVPSVNAMVLEWLDGEPLRNRLGWATSVAGGGRLLELTGRWLRVGHRALGPPIVEPLDGSPASVGWSEPIERLESGVPGLAASARAVVELGASLAGRPVATGTIHGDFSLRNVLVTGDGRVAVIDPNRYRGALVDDPARLAAELLVGRGRLATGGLAPGGHRTSLWISRMLAGFGDHDQAVFAYRCSAAVMQRWLELEAEASGPRRAVVAVNRRLFRREIGRLTA